MRPAIKKILLCGVLALVSLSAIAVIVMATLFHIPERILFNIDEPDREAAWRDKALWLSDYRIVIDAKPIEGIRKDLSGLTWNGDTQTLFGVTNNPARIVELSKDGELLRGIPLSGISDPEAIAYIGEDHFVIADERSQTLFEVLLTESTRQIDAEHADRIVLGQDDGNKGIEGLDWSKRRQRLYAAKERDPVIFEITGFPLREKKNIRIGTDEARDEALFLRDISSICFDERYGHLLILSDESRLIVELDGEGKAISSLSLLAGMHGLGESAAQAEGMALDDDGNLYLVGEPNLFYKYSKTTRPH